MGLMDIKREAKKAQWNPRKKLGAKNWQQQIEIPNCVPKFKRCYNLDQCNGICGINFNIPKSEDRLFNSEQFLF